MKEYLKNTKIYYVESMKEYVSILDLALPYLYAPWDFETFRFPSLYMSLGTWKNSTPELPSELWDLEKFHARASSWAMGLGIILSLTSYRLWN